MSNIYHVEPPTKGKVLLKTSYGDVDIELWSREAPLACRNFIQLGMEGYYDGLLFHRVIKSFMVQGGDPTGTGAGGESIYGEPFKDEIHTRLRFNHRGIVAMANENRPHTNQSQFFITLDSCEDLKGKHTIFGKVTGNTIFNVLRMGDVMTDEADRPVEPIKIESMEILSNPFDDIIPRDISQMKKRRAAAQAGNDEERKREEKKKQRLARVAKKDLKLLSFGDEAEDLEVAAVKSGPLKSSHDVLKDDPTLRAEVDETVLKSMKDDDGGGANGSSKGNSLKSVKKAVVGITEGETAFRVEGGDDDAAEFAAKMRKKLQEKKKKSGGGRSGGGEGGDSGAPMADLEAIEAEARKEEQEKRLKEKREEFKKMKEELKTLRKAAVVETGEAARKRMEEKGFREMLTPLELRRKKYLERKKMGTEREDETLTKLSKFTSGLWAKKKEVNTKDKGDEEEEKGGGKESYHGQVMEEDETEDAGPDWFLGKLKFKKHIDDEFRGGDGRKVDDYVLIDPKDQRSGGGEHRKDRHGGDRRDRR